MLLLRTARGARALSTRALSTAPQFDEAMAKAYNIVAENHRHKDGPWSRMRDKVVDAVAGRSGCNLDLRAGRENPQRGSRKARCCVLATDVGQWSGRHQCGVPPVGRKYNWPTPKTSRA